MTRTADPGILSGPLAPAVVRFALPIAASGILQQLFNVADFAVVGRYVGHTAMAAVGTNHPIINLMVNLFIGISTGVNVVIAHDIGEGAVEKIRGTVHTAVTFALASGVAIGMLMELLAPHVLSLMLVPEDVLPSAVLYLRIYLIGFPVIFLYNFLAAIFRAQGDSRTPLLCLMGSGALNVLLNLAFVVWFHRGVEGVAAATAIANLFCCLLMVVLLRYKREETRLSIYELGIESEALRRILHVGFPAGFQSSLNSVANLVIQSAINSLGSVVMAGSSAALNLEVIVHFTYSAFSQACATFVGQNNGARQYRRCRATFRSCMLSGYFFSVLLCALLFVFSRPLLGFFSPRPEVIEAGRMRMLFIFPAYFFGVTMELTSGYLRGFGLSYIPAMLALVCVCGVRLVWMFTVCRVLLNFTSVMLVYPVSYCTGALSIMFACMIASPARKAEAGQLRHL